LRAGRPQDRSSLDNMEGRPAGRRRKPADKGRPQSRSVDCAGAKSANQSYTREGPAVNKHTTEAFSIKYVGLDVHKETIAVAVAGTGTAEPRVLGIIPNDSDALRALVRKLGRPSELRVCYEAGPCGYVIQRFFQRLGIDCVIVAPSLIPRKPGDLASWAGMCPGNNESAGKRFSGKTRKGSKWLRTALVESAQAAARTKGTYLAAQYARIKGRHGHNKAVFAVAHSILVIAFHVLQRGEPYNELGGDYFIERQQKNAYQRRLVKQLERMGFEVALTSKAA
jgi:hypothetical protein